MGVWLRSEVLQMEERHPFRSFFKFALVVGALTALGRFLATKKREYYGLTESEARAKFESQMGPRIGEDKASEVADQLIPRLKETGVLRSDPIEDVVDEAKEKAADVADKMGDTVESAADKAKDMAGDAKDKAKDLAADAKDAAKSVAKEVEERVD